MSNSTATRPGMRQRPLSPHLQVYRLIPTMLMSIVHRITGAALYVGTLLVAWWLIAAATSESYFEFVNGLYGSWLGRLVLFGYTWALLHHMLGGLRQKITNEVGKGFMEEEARERGLEEDPEVVAKVETKVEEIMVTRLYGEVVTFDEKVTIPQMDEYYAQHPEKFLEPEVREGRLVVCLNPEQAGQARDKARAGAPWREILKEFGNDKGNIAQGGKITKVIMGEPTPMEVVLFAMQEGEVSDPFAMENGRHGVVMLESVTPERMPPREGLNEKIAFRIKNERREKAFKDLLAQWSEEFGVARFEENLDGLPSYEELKTVQQPENLVTRN